MLIGKTGYYILKIVLFFSFGKRDSFSIKEISGRLNISEKVLEQVLLLLKNKGILTSKRGPNGGYRLLADVSESTLLDILYMSGKKLDIMPLNTETRRKVIDEIIEDINMDMEEKISQEFKDIKIKDLLLSVKEKVNEKGLSYTI
ncbi:MAG: Rrf2 family transcriptional regulator [Candidatus Aadella gelida]|nr:Rrf2 family transcriptional regulator [Candidatus Aadella gelida]